MGGHPIVNQPGQIMQSGQLVPQYVGAAAVGDYFYANPMMAPYNVNEIGAYNPYRRLRKGNMMRRRMEGLMLEAAAERMRAMEMAELGMGYGGLGMMGLGGMGYGGLGMMGGMGLRGMGGLGFMDDSYLGYGAGRFLGPCGFPHRRGIPCPDCLDPLLV